MASLRGVAVVASLQCWHLQVGTELCGVYGCTVSAHLRLRHTWPPERKGTEGRVLSGAPRGAQIADFGLARVLQDNATHVSTKSFGTVAYMPAEVLQHNRMSRGADVYSFAMIMWELLAGRRVYEGYIATQARPSPVTSPRCHRPYYCGVLAGRRTM